MNRFKLRTVLTTFTSSLIIVASTMTYADTLRIEFSGQFGDENDLLGSSPNNPFINLVNQSFEGVIEIPNFEGSEPTEIVSLPFTPPTNRGFFTIPPNSDSSISITTGLSEFDVFEETPTFVYVDNCVENIGFACFAPDLVSIGFSFDSEISVALWLFPDSSQQFQSLIFPQASDLQSFTGQVDFTSVGNSIDSISTSFDQPITLDVSIIPDEDDDFLLNFLPAILSTLDKQK